MSGGDRRISEPSTAMALHMSGGLISHHPPRCRTSSVAKSMVTGEEGLKFAHISGWRGGMTWEEKRK